MSFTDFLSLATTGVQGLHPYVPGKPVEELQRELGLEQIIKLASNENANGPSPNGLAAAQAVLAGSNYYPDDTGYCFRNKLSGIQGFAPEQYILGSGSSDVIDMLARAFLAPGLNAVFSQHAFAMYAIYTQAVGAEGRVAAAYPADHPSMPYGHDLDAMAAMINDETRIVFIANPNNPTGTWLDKDALYAFIKNVPERCVVLLDEAYIEFVDQDDFAQGFDWVSEFPNLLVTRTFSKAYGLAGFRVGYGVASAELAAVINRVRAPFNINNAALAAAEAALDDTEFVQQCAINIQQGLKQLRAICDSQGLSYLPSVGNFLCIDMGQDAAPLFDGLLKQGVIVRPVGNYGLPNHLRVTVGTTSENQTFADALAKVLAQ